MGKYSDLVDQLTLDHPCRATARKALLDANRRATPVLTRLLNSHPDADVRHDIAELLGERKDWRAIPALIDALDDEELFVRHDAIWSIEGICKMQTGALMDWLDFSYDDTDLKGRVLTWWSLNRHYIEGNENIF